MRLWPQSNGESALREFNKCHAKDSGQFDFKGRCEDWVQEERDELARRRRVGRHPVEHLSWRQVTSPEIAAATRAKAAKRRADRQAMAGYPAYLQPDIQAGVKRDRVTVAHANPFDGSQANIPERRVELDASAKRAERLSVLRHELGHIDRLDFRKHARVTGFSKDELAADIERAGPKRGAGYLASQIIEEVRAWRNGIRRGGRMHWPTVEFSLGTYFNYALGAHSDMAGRRLRQTISTLKRYEKRVLRAKARIRKASGAAAARASFSEG